MKKTLLGLVALVVLIGLGLVGYYNRMVGAQESITSIRSQVDNMYERRKDLVPQVAAVVKKYAEYESGTLIGVTAMRTQSQNLDALNAMIAK